MTINSEVKLSNVRSMALVKFIGTHRLYGTDARGNRSYKGDSIFWYLANGWSIK